MRIVALLLIVVVVVVQATAEPIDTRFDQSPGFEAAKPPPKPPAGIEFNTTHGDYMLLQREPAMACVYGVLGEGGTAASVRISSDDKSFASYDVEASVTGANWKACLKPHPAGGDFLITASCTGCLNSTAAVLEHVTFGDLWYCAGQSNMWLPVHYTMHRNLTVASIRAGKLDNLRIGVGNSQGAGATKPIWSTARQSLGNGSAVPPLFEFSAACYYFAESLIELMAAEAAERDDSSPPLPIGIVCTAIGGSMIEEWTLNSTTASCSETSAGAHDETLWHSQVVPWLSTTVKGWTWYQGENNCHGLMGNSLQHSGYGCQMPAMIDLWRRAWSVEPGTTDPMAPFGVVTLASGGSEGGSDIGGMRWSQTGNYGTLPNDVMKNTFLAQAYDIGDPFPSKACYGARCCPNAYNATACAKYEQRLGGSCRPYCDALMATNFFMGPIHPRLKKPVGMRLAIAAMGVAYNSTKPATGPTISGCSLSQDGAMLSVSFDSALLGSNKLAVQSYNRSNAALSSFHVLVNSSLWCMQTGSGCINDGKFCDGMKPGCSKMVKICNNQQPPKCSMQPRCKNATTGDYNVPESLGCIDFGPTNQLGGHHSPGEWNLDSTWIPLNIKIGGGNSIEVDLTSLNGSAPVAIRYAWNNAHDSCCNVPDHHGWIDPLIGQSKMCTPGACPIVALDARAAVTIPPVSNSPILSFLPANPFIAKITEGKCKCLPPQKCDA